MTTHLPRRTPLALLALLAATLTACGGSSSSDPGTGGTGTANLFLQGTITATTATTIDVAGVTVTTPATVTMEGVSQPASALQPGMVVKVKAHGSGREAEGVEVEYEDAAKGTVVSTGTSSIDVGGQVVRVDDSTHFDDNGGLSSISAGQRVRISGVPDDKGGLRATRVERTSDRSNELELKGWVSGLGATGFTLKLTPDAGAAGTYTVTYASGVTPPSGLADGAFVEVHSASSIQAGQAIVASRVQLEDGSLGPSGSEAEVEGIVTSGASDRFVVAGVTVATSATTRWDGGLPVDLIPGVKVEAEGRLGSDGVLQAHKVAFKANARLSGRVTGKTGSGAAATFSVNGVAVRGDAFTDWRTSADSIADGDLVEVRGQADRTGIAVVATRVDLENGGNGRPFLRGLVTAFDAAAGTVTILGKTVTAGPSTELRGHRISETVDGPVLSASQFFGSITAGVTLVKATGERDADWSSGPQGPMREMELEND